MSESKDTPSKPTTVQTTEVDQLKAKVQELEEILRAKEAQQFDWQEELQRLVAERDVLVSKLARLIVAARRVLAANSDFENAMSCLVGASA